MLNISWAISEKRGRKKIVLLIIILCPPIDKLRLFWVFGEWRGDDDDDDDDDEAPDRHVRCRKAITMKMTHTVRS